MKPKKMNFLKLIMVALAVATTSCGTMEPNVSNGPTHENSQDIKITKDKPEELSSQSKAISELVVCNDSLAEGNSQTCSVSLRNRQDQQVLEIINAHRATLNLNPLKINPLLVYAAKNHSKNMGNSGFFDHVDPQGRNVRNRVEEVKYPWRKVAENIAFGQKTASKVMVSFMKSPGHKANILAPEFTEVGLAHYKQDGVIYWTQVFATRR